MTDWADFGPAAAHLNCQPVGGGLRRHGPPGGITWGLVTVGLAPLYVGIICVIVLGAGIMTAVSRTRAKDSS